MSVRIFEEPELRNAVGIDRGSLDCVAESFGWLHDGRAMVPPVAHVDASEHHGEVDIKTAYVRGVERFAVKIASGFPGNARLGLPTGSGMMVVFSSRTGFCEAVLLDNGYLTDLRTGLAGAIVAQWLAPKDPEIVGILGTGVQARYQLLCLALVRKVRTVLAWGRSQEHLHRYVEEMGAQHGIRIEVATSIEDLVRRSQLLITVTASRSPLIRADWLHPGLHITAVGADFPGKGELEPAVLERADRLYCDRLEQCRRLGELQHWRGARPLEAYELGAVVRGAAPGRQSEAEITLCDLTGVGVQDTAIANRGCALAAGVVD
jgi:ectoine utilization protein EutC